MGNLAGEEKKSVGCIGGSTIVNGCTICAGMETKFTLVPSRTHDAISDSLINTSKAA